MDFAARRPDGRRRARRRPIRSGTRPGSRSGFAWWSIPGPPRAISSRRPRTPRPRTPTVRTPRRRRVLAWSAPARPPESPGPPLRRARNPARGPPPPFDRARTPRWRCRRWSRPRRRSPSHAEPLEEDEPGEGAAEGGPEGVDRVERPDRPSDVGQSPDRPLAQHRQGGPHQGGGNQQQGEDGDEAQRSERQRGSAGRAVDRGVEAFEPPSATGSSKADPAMPISSHP